MSAVPPTKTIWVLEDDDGCRFVYDEILGLKYQLRFFESLAEFNHSISSSSLPHLPDLFIADLRLPDGNFLHFLSSSMKPNFFSIPLIVISSVDDIDALRICFDEGAVDYLTKPFKKAELTVKVERALSESGQLRRAVGKLEAKGRLMDLTAKEKQILALFMDSSNHVVSRSDLILRVWRNVRVHPKTLDVHLYNLRRKIDIDGLEILSEGHGRWRLVNKSGTEVKKS